MQPPSIRPLFFSFDEEVKAFRRSETDVMRQMQQKFINERISTNNQERYTHGHSWVHRANQEIAPGAINLLSAEFTIKFRDVVQGNLDIIPTTLIQAVASLNRQLMESLYKTLSDACDKTGNVVSTKETGSFAASFMEMFSRIDFGVDHDGNVSLPEIHTGEDPAKLIAELEAQPPEFHAEFQRLKAEKTEQALEKEALRKSRFKSGKCGLHPVLKTPS
jgi:hypothetical protein